jgi:hypothetical protein
MAVEDFRMNQKPNIVNSTLRSVQSYLGDWWRLGVLALLAVTVGTISFLRLIDGDEGFFLVASRLVSEGLRPYRDFLFIHAPMVPYVFGTVFKVFRPDWYAARFLSGVVAVGSGLILFDHLRRTTGKPSWGVLGAILYAGNGLVLGWFTVAKTLGLSALFMLAGTAILARRGRNTALFGGALLGLAASTRLYLGVTLICALVFVVRQETDLRRSVRKTAMLAAGALAGMLPLIVNFVRDRQAFLFGTVEYHALRDVRHAGVIGDWPQKWNTLLSVLGLEGAEGTGSLQFLGLFSIATAALLSSKSARNSLFSYNWIALFAVSLLPTPSYQQYYCLLVPFMIVEGVTLVASIEAPRLWPLIVTGLVTYCALGVFDVRRYTLTGVGVPGVLSPDRVSRWSIPMVLKISSAVDEQNLPAGGSWWPGYFVSTRTSVVIDLANDFGMVVADQVTPERRRRFHIRTHSEVTEMIRRHDPALFVEGNWAFRPSADQLPASGYTVARTVGPASIWTYRK